MEEISKRKKTASEQISVLRQQSVNLKHSNNTIYSSANHNISQQKSAFKQASQKADKRQLHSSLLKVAHIQKELAPMKPMWQAPPVPPAQQNANLNALMMQTVGIPISFQNSVIEPPGTNPFINQGHHSSMANIEDNKNNALHRCYFCTKRFFSKQQCTRHMSIHVETETVFKCKKCDIIFDNKSDLTSHSTIHNSSKTFQCTYCKAVFKLNTTLKHHILIHKGLKPHECPFLNCKRKFRKKDHLSIHLRAHSGEKPFMCKLCNKKFMDKCNIRKHIKNIHSELITSDTDLSTLIIVIERTDI